MNIEIKTMKPGLPCCLEVFKINEINADVEDFGELEREGNCFKNSCTQTFKYKLPTDEVIKKYKITLREYNDICDRLEDELYVSGCGMCS